MVYKSKFALFAMKLTRELCIYNCKWVKYALGRLVPCCYIYSPLFRDLFTSNLTNHPKNILLQSSLDLQWNKNCLLHDVPNISSIQFPLLMIIFNFSSKWTFQLNIIIYSADLWVQFRSCLFWKRYASCGNRYCQDQLTGEVYVSCPWVCLL